MWVYIYFKLQYKKFSNLLLLKQQKNVKSLNYVCTKNHIKTVIHFNQFLTGEGYLFNNYRVKDGT